MLSSAIITIGDEILIGQIVDTNSAWLSSKLNLLGVTVDQIVSIGDSREAIFSTISAAIESYNLVFVTGGLGPTKDDITKDVLCEVFGGELINHEPSRRITAEILGRSGVAMNSLNQSQSFVPSSCTVVLNHNGTAPGMMFTRGANTLFSMPGVPFEMKAMCEDSIFDIIKSKYTLLENIHHTITTFGIAESILAERIEQWENSLPDYLHLAYLPNPNRVRLRLSAYQVPNPDQVNSEITLLFEQLKQLIPNNYMGDMSDDVEVVLSRLLRQRAETVSCAESCTGGLISSRLTQLDGASQIFKGGVVAYDNSIKSGLLSVRDEHIAQYGAVSSQVVEQMALGVRRLMNTTYSIATSGVAGPTGGSIDKPVGTVWIAIATPEGVFSQNYLFGKLREPNIEKSASRAMFNLVEYILNQ